MSNPPFGDLAWLALLLPILGAAGLSFLWLLVQFVARRRAGWIAAVVLPGVLAAGTAVVMFRQILGAFQVQGGGLTWLVQRLLMLVLAGSTGLLFDLGSSQHREEGELHGRRSPWPLMLWG